MPLYDFTGVRRFENYFTGGRLTPAGRALGYAIGAGTIGATVAKNALSLEPQVFNKAPGIRQAPAMSYDFKRNPTLGASGALTMALADMNPPGQY